MPGDIAESWGISWTLPLPNDLDGSFEHGELKLIDGKDLIFKQSTNGDQDIIE